MSGHIPNKMRCVCLPAILVVAGLTLLGCDKGKPGPKYKDDAAAHARRYHPEVARSDVSGTPASAPARHAITQPSDIDFTATGAIGCPVLFVNGDSLNVAEVLEPLIQDLREKANSLPLPAYRTHVFRTVANQIDYAVSMTVIYQEAKNRYTDEKQIQLFEKEADRLVRDVINKRFGGVAARYEAHLKSLDLKTEDIKARAKRQVMVMQFLHERFKPLAVEPTRRQLAEYYHSHLDEFSTPASAQLLIVDIPLDKEMGKPINHATPAEIAASRSRAREQLVKARAELAAGADFGEIARKYAKGVRAKAGGDWGEITPGSMTGRMARASEVLFTLQQGQLSDIIDTDDAVFIVKSGKLTPATTLDFQQAQEQIIDKLAEQEFNRHREAYVQQLLQKATISQRQGFFEAVLAAVPRPAAIDPALSGSATPRPKR